MLGIKLARALRRLHEWVHAVGLRTRRIQVWVQRRLSDVTQGQGDAAEAQREARAAVEALNQRLEQQRQEFVLRYQDRSFYQDHQV